MGFYKDFENEIKIFFVLLGLVIMVGWFGAIGSLSLFHNSYYESEAPKNSVVPVIEEPTVIAPVVEEVVEVTGFVQYSNQTIGVSFEYPAEWYIYNEEKWVQDNAIAQCETTGVIENTVILSRKNLGRCVGVQAFNAWPGDLLISFSEKEWKDFPFVMSSEEKVSVGEIGGFSAARYLFNEHSLDTRKQAVRVYINAKQKGYIIEFTQEDLQGNYDPVFEEILASMQWL